MIQLYNIILIKKTPINRLAHIKLSKKGNVDYIIYKTFIKWEGGSIKDILNSIFFLRGDLDNLITGLYIIIIVIVNIYLSV